MLWSQISTTYRGASKTNNNIEHLRSIEKYRTYSWSHTAAEKHEVELNEEHS